MRIRPLTLSAGFFGLAVVLLGTGVAPAQPPRSAPLPPPGQHDRLSGPLSADAVKQALGQFSQTQSGLPPELTDLIQSKLKSTGSHIDPKTLNDILNWMKTTSPEHRQQLEDLAKALRGNLSPEEIARLKQAIPMLSGGKLPRPNGGSAVPSLPPLGRQIDSQFPPTQPAVPPRGPFPNLPLPTGTGKGPPPTPGSDGQPTRPQPEPGAVPRLPFGEFNGRQENPLDRLTTDDLNESPQEHSRRMFAALWERNIGSLDDTPAVRRALFDLVDGAGDLRDSGGEKLWESLFKEGGGSASSLAELLGEAVRDGHFKLPDLDLHSRDGEYSGSRSHSTEEVFSSESSWSQQWSGWRGNGSGSFGGAGAWVPAVIVTVVLFGGLLLWRFGFARRANRAAAFRIGIDGWPVDPRRITTRRDVVQAFEYLTVSLCGAAAAVWTHTIAARSLILRAAAPPEVAADLARLYEIARYAPLDEPPTSAEVEEARRIVCRLAGLGGE